MEYIFPDWPGTHPLPDNDPRDTLLIPFGRALPDADELALGQRVCLDSGAFGRSFQPMVARQPFEEWATDLAAWYTRASEALRDQLRWCVAPDVFGNPGATYQQWRHWRNEYPGIPVAPVIQLWPNSPTDLFAIQRQAKQYAHDLPTDPSTGRRVIMLSNPARFTAPRWGATLSDALSLIRQACGAETHIHLLGAGWSVDDARQYAQVAPALSSLDSITYYLTVERGERWCRCALCADDATPWPVLALHHAALLRRAVGMPER